MVHTMDKWTCNLAGSVYFRCNQHSYASSICQCGLSWNVDTKLISRLETQSCVHFFKTYHVSTIAIRALAKNKPHVANVDYYYLFFYLFFWKAPFRMLGGWCEICHSASEFANRKVCQLNETWKRARFLSPSRRINNSMRASGESDTRLWKHSFNI